MEETVKACIFDIQPYSIHDGPGIRTTVFFKGCPLRCLWCHNPESNEPAPQLMYYSAKCVGCGTCIAACPQKAVAYADGKVATNRNRCVDCGLCSKVCLFKARELTGKSMSVAEVFEKVISDKMFYDSSGGGVTLSGGEPLSQPNFVHAFIHKCKENGVHTTVETCGYASQDNAKKALEEVDLVFYDIKAIDQALHERLTGVKNERILSNAVMIRKVLKKPMVIRIPVVPGHNDSKENIEATAKFIAEQLDKDVPVHLLPYHELGDAKLDSLESSKSRLNITPPAAEHMEELKTLMSAYGLNVQVGGAM